MIFSLTNSEFKKRFIMKIVQKVVVVCFVSLSFGVVAQEKVQHEGMAKKYSEHRIEYLEKELNLTPEQVKQIKTIHRENAKKQEALRKEMNENKEQERKATKAVLTEEQQEKMKAMHAERKDEAHKKEKRKIEEPHPCGVKDADK
jgi:Spy/CpxP family protein refolding chaperone